MHFFGQFNSKNSEKKHGSSTNDPIFSSTFPALTVGNIRFSINSQNQFSCGPTLWSILVSKTLQFWEKAIDSDNPSSFSRK